jgi:ABC-type transporter Mla maintaining outer membrane lipid asymmetry ATPase subunit MlaF
MLPLPPGSHGQISMSFLILRDGHAIFDGSARDLAQSRDEYIREYIS